MALRVLVSVVMLALLVPRVHLPSLLPRWNVTAVVWLAAALGATFLGVVLSTLRWQRVTKALGLPARGGRLLSHYLAGLFVSNFLIGTTAGDVLRVLRLSADTGERPASFASVVLERLSGWVVLPVITLIGLFVNPGLRHLGTASRLALAVALATLVLLVAVLAAAASQRVAGRMAGHEGWLRFVGAVHLGVDRFRRHPGAVVGVLAAGFAYQLMVVVSVWLAAAALRLDVGFTAMLAFVPAVAIAQVLPLSIGGLGLREAAMVVFLTPLGVPASQAVALGLVFYGINLVASLVGAPAFAVGGQRPARALA